jgi:hypothetical protein
MTNLILSDFGQNTVLPNRQTEKCLAASTFRENLEVLRMMVALQIHEAPKSSVNCLKNNLNSTYSPCDTLSLEMGHEHITNNHRSIVISLPIRWSWISWIQIWEIQRT